MTAKNYFQTVTVYAFYYRDDQVFWKDHVLALRDRLLVTYKTGMVEMLSNHLQKNYTKQAVTVFLNIAETCAFIPADGRHPNTVIVKTLPLGQIQNEGNRWVPLKDAAKHVYLTKARSRSTVTRTIEQWSFETLKAQQLKTGVRMEVDAALLHMLKLYRAVVNMIIGLDLYIYVKGE